MKGGSCFHGDGPYFWRHVIGCAAEGVGGSVEIDLQFAHAEIGDANVPFVVQKNVVQLQISVVFFLFLLFFFSIVKASVIIRAIFFGQKQSKFVKSLVLKNKVLI